MKSIETISLKDVQAVVGEMTFMQALAHAGKIAHGIFVAKKS